MIPGPTQQWAASQAAITRSVMRASGCGNLALWVKKDFVRHSETKSFTPGMTLQLNVAKQEAPRS